MIDSKNTSAKPYEHYETHDDFLERAALHYAKHAPFALSLRELNRLLALQRIQQRMSLSFNEVLDVGCGDGYWWNLKPLPANKIFGIDISSTELKKAKKHITAEYCDISQTRPFENKKFDFVLGNCSLEHVPDIQGALNNIALSLKEDAHLVMFVPAPNWAYQGHTQSFLLKHFPRIAMMISGMKNGFFQHWHLYNAKVWKSLLAYSNLEVVDSFGLGGARSEFMYRLFLWPAFVSFIGKKIFGSYPNELLKYLPSFVSAPTQKLLMWSLKTSFVDLHDQKSYEICLVAKLAKKPK
jgi:SAM-dependent methyltransferase